LRTFAIRIHYRSRESWTTINSRRLIWNTALLIRAGVERVLVSETGHETTTEGEKWELTHICLLLTPSTMSISPLLGQLGPTDQKEGHTEQPNGMWSKSAITRPW
jgi:hypothetical protein